MTESLFNNVAGLRRGIGVFLGMLQNFQEHLYLQNTSGDCFHATLLKRDSAAGVFL